MNLINKPNKLEYGSFEDYEIISLIGRGKNSNVYKGINIKNKNLVAIKVFKDIPETEVYKEINILKLMQKEENISKILDVLYDPFTCNFSIILEYINAFSYSELKRNLKKDKIKNYIFECLKIIRNIHKKKIIHCDIKPQNIIIDKRNLVPKFIDFSHSYSFEEEKKSLKRGCIFYKAPELLLGHRKYNEKIDIWALGCIFVELLFNKRVFFQGKNNYEQLEYISDIFGTKSLYDLCKKFNIDYNILKDIKFKNKINFWDSNNEYYNLKINEEGKALVKLLLEIDPNKRISAEEALKHNYFKN